jgi:hypothetical protein
MRRISVALLSLVTIASTAVAQDAANKVSDGGIKIAGWQGTVDKSGENGAMTVADAKLEPFGSGAMHVVTGPAITYWNPANKASGNYTVKATFHEPKFQGLNSHPHPYGIMIGGNDLGTENASMIYCSAYGTGTFIVRGFGPTPFSVSSRRPEANAAINKASAVGAEVQQEVALSVKGDKIECAINGTVVGSYNKADVIGAGKLKSTDGVYGIRFGHNTEAHVAGFAMTKQ